MNLNYNKDKIANLFVKNIFNYNKYAKVQKKSIENLIQLLNQNNINNNNINSILEIGSGSGLLTSQLIKQFPNSTITCIDFIKNVIQYNNILYIYQDFEKYKFDKKYDLIISNFTLQWMENLNYCIENMMNNAKYVIFTIPLDSSFKEINKIYKKYNLINTFLSLPNIAKILQYINIFDKNIVYKIKTTNIKYENLLLFFQTLKKIGANYSNKNNTISQIRKIIKENNNSIIINYDVLYCIIYDKN